ncbi:hypothetical protein FRZ44_48760 [Hypericibacter terrae]|jgi:hypothetical protein|uniref:Transcription factor NusA N-terminal domain-containing protein n=1 Tax=Hypericibacter terrae TaxID=2602015 RepID=A0A5J6MQU0_9PROT|nr:DUF6494 family protein [Hypericibacter terrae]QEX19561.1 hypothetical protein FRZ44_48760 [Hypericibacter terrae]
MNEDVFNMSLRKFLKQVGVTSQRAIEVAVREAAAQGRTKGKGPLKARMTLTIDSIGLRHEVEEEIDLG